MNATTRKRKIDSDSHDTRKRLKLTTASGSSRAANVSTSETSKKDNLTQVAEPGVQESKDKEPDKADATGPDRTASDSKRRRINRLVPPRPFPTVPTSVSATGPRSAHKEGKNYICLTRKTSLGAYMRRCKDVILKDGCVSASLHSLPYSCSNTDTKPCTSAQWAPPYLFSSSFQWLYLQSFHFQQMKFAPK